MKIAVIGSNGMLSVALTKLFIENNHAVDVYGLNKPNGYEYSNYYHCNLLEDELNYASLMKNDMIVYASGAGVQAALDTPPSLMYSLNVNVPIEITLQLKEQKYRGTYVSFGSYMEIGLNKDKDHSFTEDEIVGSLLSVTNDYALSKRLYGRYMNDLQADYTHWHFILPNMFSYNDINPGTRLIPYILKYIRDFKAGNNIKGPSFSAGLQTRQFILLEDIFTVLRKAILFKMPSGIYNVGGGEFMSIRSLIERIFSYFNVPCKDSYFGNEIRRDGDIKSLRISGEKLYSKIGYLPSTKIEEILPSL